MNELFSPEESFRSSTDRKTAPYARRRAGKGTVRVQSRWRTHSGYPSGPELCVRPRY